MLKRKRSKEDETIYQNRKTLVSHNPIQQLEEFRLRALGVLRLVDATLNSEFLDGSGRIELVLDNLDAYREIYQDSLSSIDLLKLERFEVDLRCAQRLTMLIEEAQRVVQENDFSTFHDKGSFMEIINSLEDKIGKEKMPEETAAQ